MHKIENPCFVPQEKIKVRIGSMHISMFLLALLSFHLSSPGGGLHASMAALTATPKFHRDTWQRINPAFKPLLSGSL
jgi:hypothetical protein